MVTARRSPVIRSRARRRRRHIICCNNCLASAFRRQQRTSRTLSGFSDLQAQLDERKRQDLYRRRRIVTSAQGREITVDGRSLLNFCSNDYLGLAGDARVAAALTAAADKWAVGSGAAHLVCGHTAAHHDLEQALAEFCGRPRALLFSSGYAANVGTLNALLGKGDYVFEDRLNHASLLDGGLSSGARFRRYGHRDSTDLELSIHCRNPGYCNRPSRLLSIPA